VSSALKPAVIHMKQLREHQDAATERRGCHDPTAASRCTTANQVQQLDHNHTTSMDGNSSNHQGSYEQQQPPSPRKYEQQYSHHQAMNNSTTALTCNILNSHPPGGVRFCSGLSPAQLATGSD
jgi:hypothetical protein